MVTSINEIKKKAMESVVGDDHSINEIEKRYWEYVYHHGAGGGSGGSGDVTSVNGHKGDVVLTAGDVGAYTKAEVDGADGKLSSRIATLESAPKVDAYSKTESDAKYIQQYVHNPLKYDTKLHKWVITQDPVVVESEISGYKAQFDSLKAQLLSTEARVSKLEAAPAHTPSGGHDVTPVAFDPANVELTGGFGEDYSSVITFSNHKKGSPISVVNGTGKPAYAFVLMTPEAAGHVTGITLDGGLPAMWDKKGVEISNTNYVAFKSPYKLTAHSVEIGFNWK